MDPKTFLEGRGKGHEQRAGKANLHTGHNFDRLPLCFNPVDCFYPVATKNIGKQSSYSLVIHIQFDMLVNTMEYDYGDLLRRRIRSRRLQTVIRRNYRLDREQLVSKV